MKIYDLTINTHNSVSVWNKNTFHYSDMVEITAKNGNIYRMSKTDFEKKPVKKFFKNIEKMVDKQQKM